MKSIYKRTERTNYSFMLNSETKNWFKNRYGSYIGVQAEAIESILNKNHTLIISQTGTGKTMAAFAGLFDQLISDHKNNTKTNSIKYLYLSPLKSLVNDMQKSLNEPILAIFEETDIKITCEIRTGDTTPYRKQKMLRSPPDILITTPESLAVCLSNPKFLNVLNLKAIVIDEIHSLFENKRGVDLNLSITRLLHEITTKPVLIGLSATVSPDQEIANYLSNYEPVNIIRSRVLRDKLLVCICPTTDYFLNPVYANTKLEEAIAEIVNKHTTTLIFTNTRAKAEKLSLIFAKHSPNLLPSEIAVHHSSLEKALRLNTENLLKEGKIRVVLSSSSLELGIDIGLIDAVIQIGSPKSIARCLQRVGRSGHSINKVISGYFLSLTPDELLELAIMLKLAYENVVDDLQAPLNSLDILCQHIVGISLLSKYTIAQTYEIIRKSYNYRNLSLAHYNSVIQYLTNKTYARYAKIEILEMGEKSYISEKRGFRINYLQNIGTIKESVKIAVKLDKIIVGYIEESYLEKLTKGSVFALGGKLYAVIKIDLISVKVIESFAKQPDIPVWYSDYLPLNHNLAKAISEYRNLLLINTLQDSVKMLDNLLIDANSKDELMRYIGLQKLWLENSNAKLEINEIMVEYVEVHIKPTPEDKSSEDKSYLIIVFHTLKGRRFNDAFARIISYHLSEKYKIPINLKISDNGVAMKCKLIDIDILQFFTKPRDITAILKLSLDNSQLFRRKFRQIASRGLMILSSKTTVGRSQLSSRILFNAINAASKDKDSHPLITETYREIMDDLFDINYCNAFFEDILSKKIVLNVIKSNIISPFSHHILAFGNFDDVGSEKFVISNVYGLVSLQKDPLYIYNTDITFFSRGIIINHKDNLYLVISDLHIGYEEALYKSGLYENLGLFDTLLLQLTNYITELKPKYLVIIGDIKDNFSELTEMQKLNLSKLILQLRNLNITPILLRGNHDNFLEVELKQYGIKLIDNLVLGNINLTHGHKITDNETCEITIIGHEHMSITLKTKSEVSNKYKCFLTANCTLPSLNSIKIIAIPAFADYKEGIGFNKQSYLSPYLKVVNNSELYIPEGVTNQWHKYVYSLDKK